MKNICQKKLYSIIALLIAVFAFTTIYSSANNTSVAYAEDNQEIYYGDDAYFEDGATSWSETEYINYATKTATNYRINRTYPEYFNLNSNITNTCANVAGSNIIGFYDRYYDNLIPDCTVGYMGARYYVYDNIGQNSTQIQGVINDLYVRMSTNNPLPGTTQAQYKTGLTSYFTSKGKTTTYNSVMTNSSFDFTKVITQLNNGYPITLYLSGYNFTDIMDTGSSAILCKTVYTGNHIVVAYGYQNISYYDANGALIKNNIYLYVATGFSANQYLYIVDNNGTLNDAEAVQMS